MAERAQARYREVEHQRFRIRAIKRAAVQAGATTLDLVADACKTVAGSAHKNIDRQPLQRAPANHTTATSTSTGRPP
jgi:hypothetical protein